MSFVRTVECMRRGLPSSTLRKITGAITLCCLLLAGLAGQVRASHYAGGEIIVDWLGGENYRFTQRIYRDCQGISLGSQTFLNLSPAVPTGSLTLNVTSIVDITPLCSGQASPCPNSFGVYGIEEHTFTTTVSGLQPNTNYLVDATSLCCRNAAITTVTNAGGQQMYLYTNFRTGIQNSSPRFLNRPFGQFCANQPAVLSPNGFDPDGEFPMFWGSGKVDGAAILNGSNALVPILFGPRGDRRDTLELVKRGEKWYLLRFAP